MVGLCLPTGASEKGRVRTVSQDGFMADGDYRVAFSLALEIQSRRIAADARNISLGVIQKGAPHKESQATKINQSGRRGSTALPL